MNEADVLLLATSEVASMARRVCPEWQVAVVDDPHPHTKLPLGAAARKKATVCIPLRASTLSAMLRTTNAVDPGAGRAMCLFLAAHELGHIVACESAGGPRAQKPAPLMAFILNVVEDGFIDGNWMRNEFPAWSQFNRLVGAVMLQNAAFNLDAVVGDGSDPAEMARALLVAAMTVLTTGQFVGEHGPTRHFAHPRAEQLWQLLAPLIDESMANEAESSDEKARIADDIYRLLIGTMESGSDPSADAWDQFVKDFKNSCQSGQSGQAGESGDDDGAGGSGEAGESDKDSQPSKSGAAGRSKGGEELNEDGNVGGPDESGEDGEAEGSGGSGESDGAGEDGEAEGSGGSGESDESDESGEDGEAGGSGGSGTTAMEEELGRRLLELLGVDEDDLVEHGCPGASKGCGDGEKAPIDWNQAVEDAGLGDQISVFQSEIERRQRAAVREAGRLARTGVPDPPYRQYIGPDAPEADLRFDGEFDELVSDMCRRLRRTISPLMNRKDLRRLGSQTGKGLSLQCPVEVGMACADIAGRRIWRSPLREVDRHDGLDVMVVLDVSGSMGGLAGEDPLIVHASAAVIGLCQAISAWPMARAGVICFADHGGMVLPLGAGIRATASLKRGIRSAYAGLGGGTVLAPALRWAGAILDGRDDHSRQAVVILVTDAVLMGGDAEACKQVRAELAEVGIPIIGFALGGAKLDILADVCDGLVDIRADGSQTEAHLRRVLYRIVAGGGGPKARVA